MTDERPCLRLTQDGDCAVCGTRALTTDVMRDGRPMVESMCHTCNSYRVDLKEPLSQQNSDTGFVLTQSPGMC